MISLVTDLPEITMPRAETVKINTTYDLYSDIALFWIQNDNNAVISLLDGNMVIYNNCADIDELREFINVISPQSVFSDADTLSELFGKNFQKVFVMKSDHRFECELQSDTLNSEKIYTLLNVDGLDLPPYEFFAVDFCHKLNHGKLRYFAIENKCAAVGVCDGQAVLVNGIASHHKGMGTVALCGLLSQYNTIAIAVCKEQIIPFYLKNNFSLCYEAGYWRKNS